MNSTLKNWLWFLLILGVLLGMGMYVAKHRRAEPGPCCQLSLADDQAVDPALIHYVEVTPIVSSIATVSAVAVDHSGRIFIGGENAIEEAGGKPFSVEGTPICLAVDASGRIYAGMTNRIIMISPLAEPTVIEIPSDRAYLTSLAVDENYIYAADAGSRKLWRFSHAGGEAFEIGAEGVSGWSGFHVPSPYFDVALAAKDSIWAVSPGDHALGLFTVDGKLLDSWAQASMDLEGFGGCCNPAHIALLPDGGIVTAEKGVVRVKVYNSDGSLRCVVAPPSAFDKGVVGLDLAVDQTGRIYVLDPVRKQVRVFEEKR